MGHKDITKCYGLLKDCKESLDIVEKESAKARKERLMDLRLLNKLTEHSKLTEKDVEELSTKIKAGIAKAHERRK